MRREAEKKRGCRVAKDRIGIISFKIFSLTNLLARIKWMASKLFRKKTMRLMNEAGTVEERQVGKRRKEERQRQAEAGKLFRKKTLRLMKEERQRRRDAEEKRRRGEERRDKS